MARHAGFGVVASIRQGDINGQLEHFFSNVGPFFFPPPQTITVGGVPVTFGGLMQVAAPVVELHPNPLDLITLHLAVFGTLNAQIAGAQPRKWTVRVDTAVSARLLLGPINGQITLRLDTSTVVFQPLTVTILSGPPPPPALIAALQSPAFAASATASVQALPPVTLANLAPAQLTHTQPASFKDSNFSVFNWFTINLTVSRTELRIFEGAVTIAADFAGITNGDRNALVDLTRAHGGGYILVETITEKSNPSSPPFPVPRNYKPQSNLALTFNIGVLSHIIEHQVSPQIAGTPVSKQAVINWIRVGYSWFEKPLRGKEHGLEIRIGATAKGVDADLNVYLQPFARTFDGPTNFIRPDQGWLIYVARVDIDLPWWADLAIGIAQVLSLATALVLTFPAILNTVGLGIQAGLLPMKMLEDLLSSINDKFAKGDPANIAAAQQLTMQKGAYDAGLPHVGLVRYMSISPGGIDVGQGSGAERPFALPATPTGGARITPSLWSVYDTSPIMTALQLDPNWQKLNQNNLQVIWEVRRKDTNAVIATATRPYNSAGSNGVAIPHHTKDLYGVSEFAVNCRLVMPMGNTIGEIWSGNQTIRIADALDRSKPFVEWGGKYVYFANAGTGNKYWARYSRSRIHRTAVALRCKMLRVRVFWRQYALEHPEENWQAGEGPGPGFDYLAALPFAWEHLNSHRRVLCEYCFFGSPQNHKPYPRDDWFVPVLPVKFKPIP